MNGHDLILAGWLAVLLWSWGHVLYRTWHGWPN